MYQGKYTVAVYWPSFIVGQRQKNGKMNPSFYDLKDVSISKCDVCVLLPFHFSESPGSIVSRSSFLWCCTLYMICTRLAKTSKSVIIEETVVAICHSVNYLDEALECVTIQMKCAMHRFYVVQFIFSIFCKWLVAASFSVGDFWT